MGIRKDINDLIRVRDKVSLSRLLMIVGVGQIFIYTALLMDRIFNLEDKLFVDSLSSAVLLLGGIFTLLGGLYSWSKFIDRKKEDKEEPKIGG